jgi:hypothetical protein
MRATVDGVELEGTPEEIAAFLNARGAGPHQPIIASPPALGPSSNDDDERFASEKIAFRTLKRRPLSSSQRELFKTLSKAYPNWVSASALQDALGHTANQLGGTLGGIGRRLSTTDGYVVGSSMIEWMWDADEGQWAYRLPDSVQKAVLRFNL